MLVSLRTATKVPGSDRTGFDETGAAVTGLFCIEGTPTHPKSPPIIPICDNVVGWFGTVGVLAALRRRAIEGGSYRVTVSLTCTVLWLLSLGIFDKAYAKATAGSSEEHTYVAPDLFTAGDSAWYLSGTYRPGGHVAHTRRLPYCTSSTRVIQSGMARVAQLSRKGRARST